MNAMAELDETIATICRDDLARLESHLAADRALVTRRMERDLRLDAGIFHWLYVGDTALHVAAAGHRTALVRMLLAAGADANAAHNRRGARPLHYAADGYVAGDHWDAEKQVSTLHLLIEAGAELNAQDQNGATALHRATRTRCAAAVNYLLDAGADPALRNESGSTAFHLAVQTTGRGGSGDPVAKQGQMRIIESFLARRVSPQLRDGKGHTVLECAARSEWVLALLQQSE